MALKLNHCSSCISLNAGLIFKGNDLSYHTDHKEFFCETQKMLSGKVVQFRSVCKNQEIHRQSKSLKANKNLKSFFIEGSKFNLASLKCPHLKYTRVHSSDVSESNSIIQIKNSMNRVPRSTQSRETDRRNVFDQNLSTNSEQTDKSSDNSTDLKKNGNNSIPDNSVNESSNAPEIKPLNSTIQKQIPGNNITIEDLLVMIKEAEKNILLLNRVRTRALEEMNQAKTENEYLLGQQKVMQAKLAESDAKINLFAQTKAKNAILEEQLQNVQKRLSESQEKSNEINLIQQELTELKEKLTKSETKALQFAEVQSKNKILLESIDDLKSKVKELEMNEVDLKKSHEQEMVLKMEEMNELRTQLAEMDEKIVQLLVVKEELNEIREEEKELKKSAEGLETSKQVSLELEKELEKVKERLIDSEEKNKQLEEITEENNSLRAKLEKLATEVSSMEKNDLKPNEEILKLNNEIVALEKQVEEGNSIEKSLKNVTKEKNELEKELETVKIKLSERNIELENAVKLLESSSNNENKSFLQKKVDSVKDRLNLLNIRDEEEAEFMAKERQENLKLKEQNQLLAEKLKAAEMKVNELEAVESKMERLGSEIDSMNLALAQTAPLKETAEQINKQNLSLRERIKLLEANLAEKDAEQQVYVQSQQENEILIAQIELLKQKLLESDTEMKAQLETYQKEVENFQSSIELLSSDAINYGYQLPVSEMKWEFWSNLLLRIDDLMLSKLIPYDIALELRLMAWKRDSRIRDLYEEMEAKDDKYVAAQFKDLIQLKSKPGLHVVHIAAEMAPVAKVGGLADVITGLGKALQKRGHLVEIILPKYDCIDYSRIVDLKVMDFDLVSFFDGQLFQNKVWRGIVEGLPVYFIEPLHPGKFFWRGSFYGCHDDFLRFTYFCRAALEFLFKSKKKPDVIHSHDWQTAIVAPLYWDVYVPLGLDSAKLAFTCHNFEYQGTENPNALSHCGLNVQKHYRPDRMQDNFASDRINLLKGAFVYSNLVTTVSPTYAIEVRGPDGGKGLQVTLAQHSKKFHGVLNGIDVEVWNPSSDPLIEYQYSADDLEGKKWNKSTLRSRLGLSSSEFDFDKPIVGCITRLVPQKGVHLIRHAIYHTLEKGGQFVLLGSSPVPDIQRDFENIAQQFSKHPNIRLVLKYDEALSHLIYAGSDIFIIPSIFEPCGLTQLIAMRYGSIPVARKTGGLADSVFDLDDPSIPMYKKNGFTFSATDEKGLSYALDRALNYYYNDPETWEDLVASTMRMDFSWEESSAKYIELYQNAILSSS